MLASPFRNGWERKQGALLSTEEEPRDCNAIYRLSTGQMGGIVPKVTGMRYAFSGAGRHGFKNGNVAISDLSRT